MRGQCEQRDRSDCQREFSEDLFWRQESRGQENSAISTIAGAGFAENRRSCSGHSTLRFTRTSGAGHYLPISEMEPPWGRTFEIRLGKDLTTASREYSTLSKESIHD